jgi:hypothetical protein
MSEVLGRPIWFSESSFDLQMNLRDHLDKDVEIDDLVLRLHVVFEYRLEAGMMRLPMMDMQARLPSKINLDI